MKSIFKFQKRLEANPMQLFTTKNYDKVDFFHLQIIYCSQIFSTCQKLFGQNRWHIKYLKRSPQ